MAYEMLTKSLADAEQRRRPICLPAPSTKAAVSYDWVGSDDGGGVIAGAPLLYLSMFTDDSFPFRMV